VPYNDAGLDCCGHFHIIEKPCQESIGSWLARQSTAKTIAEIAEHFDWPIEDAIKRVRDSYFEQRVKIDTAETIYDLPIFPLGFVFYAVDIKWSDDEEQWEIEVAFESETLIYFHRSQLSEEYKNHNGLEFERR